MQVGENHQLLIVSVDMMRHNKVNQRLLTYNDFYYLHSIIFITTELYIFSHNERIEELSRKNVSENLIKPIRKTRSAL